LILAALTIFGWVFGIVGVLWGFAELYRSAMQSALTGKDVK